MAIFSPCGKYRYVLSRYWDKDKGKILFIGLNPSIAGANSDDRTVSRLTQFCKLWGYGGFRIINVFALVATNRQMLGKVDDPIGPDNDRYFEKYKGYKKVIFMWGASEYIEQHEERINKIIEMFPRGKCFRKTKSGHPEHPLYIPYTCEPIKYRKKTG